MSEQEDERGSEEAMSEKEDERGSEEASEESEETTDVDAEEGGQTKPLSGYRSEGEEP